MAAFRPDIPPHVAAVIRHLHPDLKRSVKQAIRSISREPLSGEPLVRELEGLRKFTVRRFRIVYAVDRERRIVRIFAVGHRREIYDDLAEKIRRSKNRR